MWSSTTSARDEHLRPTSHVPGASTSIDVGSQRRPTEDRGCGTAGSGGEGSKEPLADHDLEWECSATTRLRCGVRYRRPGASTDQTTGSKDTASTSEAHYELLKGLLTAGLIAFSDSPWASPIVIVLKKNGVDIR
ncbi:unnamed protein product [Phytophthora fragariaefolia]|uniref:Unnamed protein product n=1 Tax=Phytophthora fragariaefolia TaxID=1490495 RepID=A0A9W6X6E7_9STRA|nr:unnamed protein product [Phytophthora fragariaefolia]